jgi:hypothetical protein
MRTTDFIKFKENLRIEPDSKNYNEITPKRVKEDISNLFYPSQRYILELLTHLSYLKNKQYLNDDTFDKTQVKLKIFMTKSSYYNFDEFLTKSINLENPLFSEKDINYDFNTKQISNRYSFSSPINIIFNKKFHNDFILPFTDKIDSPDFDFNKESENILNGYLEYYSDFQSSSLGYSFDKLVNHIRDNNLTEELFKAASYQNILYKDQKDNKDFLDNNFDSPIFEDKATGLTYESFLDSTMIIHSPNGDINVVHPLHTWRAIKQLEFQHVKYSFRKTPFIIKNIINECGSDELGLYHEDNNFSNLLHLKEVITDNRNFIKNSGFDLINSFKKHYNIELLVDDINKQKLTHEAKRNFKSFLNSNTKYLLTEKNISIFEKINEQGFNRNEIQNFVFNDISHYQVEESTPKEEVDIKLESFSHSLIAYKNYLVNGFTKEKQKIKISQNNHSENTIFETDSTLLQKIQTEQESLLYGNNSWCISRKDSYKTFFSKYKKEGCNQYFYYDFAEEKNAEIMIGITTDKFGNSTFCCDNTNSSYLSNPKLKDLEMLIKNNDKTIEKEIKKDKKRGLKNEQ